MIRLILAGACGRMGKAVRALAEEEGGFEFTALIDPSLSTSFATCQAKADVVIDFSTPAALPDELRFCVANGLPLVLATTGHGEGVQARIDDAAESIAILQSANLSYGAYVLTTLSSRAIALLGNGYDVAIVETHHRAKKDAPSGTAKLLAEAVGSRETPTASVRGGAVVGVHTVGFYGDRDVISLTHEALDRRLFAKGALDAAKWIAGCAPGLYGMGDLFSENGQSGQFG